jgi:hypothetical protein
MSAKAAPNWAADVGNCAVPRWRGTNTPWRANSTASELISGADERQSHGEGWTKILDWMATAMGAADFARNYNVETPREHACATSSCCAFCQSGDADRGRCAIMRDRRRLFGDCSDDKSACAVNQSKVTRPKPRMKSYRRKVNSESFVFYFLLN